MSFMCFMVLIWMLIMTLGKQVINTGRKICLTVFLP